MTNQLTYTEASEQLRAAYEQEKIQLTAHISTLEVVVSQQTIKINKLEKAITFYDEVVNDWRELVGMTEVDWQAIKESKDLGVDNN